MWVLGAGQAQALVVTVNGQQWNVTTFTGSFNANSSKFNTAANGGTMPWFGSNSENFTVDQFATAVNTQLAGAPDFAYLVLVNVNNCPPFPCTSTPVSIRSREWVGSGTGSVTTDVANTTLYAQAELVPPVPVPGPLPALGAAAAFGFSRKLRKRIKSNTNPVSSTFSL
jgi:hypothetical protein